MNTKVIIVVLLCVPFLVYIGIITYNDVIFDIDIGGHMKRAADSNTIELATQEMKIVIENMENRNMINGYTSIIYRTPDEDIGFWYVNMKQSLIELETINSNSTQLEKSNVLMKLRETLIDSGESVKITVPPGISRFPYNTFYAIIGIITFVIFCISCIITVDELEL